MIETTETLCTRREATAIIHKARGKFFVRGSTFLQTSDENGVTRGFTDIGCYIKVSRKAAAKYVTDILTDTFDARGARIKITTGGVGNCIFVG